MYERLKFTLGELFAPYKTYFSSIVAFSASFAILYIFFLKMHRAHILALLTLFLSEVSAKSDTISELYKIAVSVKECLSNKYPAVCLKERALEAINETIFLDEPIMIGYIRIEKNHDYDWNKTKEDVLPNEISKRSIVLNNALYDKLQDFFKSRTIKLNVDEAIEGKLLLTHTLLLDRL